MEALQDWIQIIMFSLVAIGYLYNLLKKVEDPDQKASDRIAKIETICPIQHLSIEEKFKLMNEKSLVVDNHLRHIEKDIAEINKNIAIILDREIHILDREMKKRNIIK